MAEADSACQIQELERLASSQARQIPELEAENARLRRQRAEAQHKKAELGQRVTHGQRELAVMGEQFNRALAEVGRVRQEAGAPGGGQEEQLLQVTQGVRELRVTHCKEAGRRREEVSQVQEGRGQEAGALGRRRMELQEQIPGMTRSLEDKDSKRKKKEGTMQQAKEFLEEKKSSCAVFEKKIEEAKAEEARMEEQHQNMKVAHLAESALKQDNARNFEIEIGNKKRELAEKKADNRRLIAKQEKVAKVITTRKDEITDVQSLVKQTKAAVSELATGFEEKQEAMQMMENKWTEKELEEMRVELMKTEQ